MKLYHHDLLSSQIGPFPEDEQSSKGFSRFALHEKCDNAQQDEQSYAECKKSVNNTRRASPRLARKTRVTADWGDRPAKSYGSGEGLPGTAKFPSQRLDALTLFNSQSHAAFVRDPDQALWFTEESVSKAATAMWREMRSSNGFVTYEENKRKPKEKKGESIWANEMEYIFCKALVRWPPMGRKKVFYRDKKRGKNELIVQYIYEQSGEVFDRKVISSHIQTIRRFFLDRPKVLRYVPFAKKIDKHSIIRKSKSAEVRRARCNPMNSTLPTEEIVRENVAEDDFLPVEPQLGSRALIPYYFEMFVTDPREDMPAYLHVFTKSDKWSWLPDAWLQDIRNRQTLIMPMSAILESGLSLCQIIVCEASLDILREPLPNGADLGIQFEFKSNHELANYNFECFTSIFDGEECVDSSSGRIGYDAEGSKRLHKIPFGSSFWAHKMGGFTKSIREIEKKRNVAYPDEEEEDLERLQQDTEDQIVVSIDSLSATQEIFAISKVDGHTERVLLVHWTFKYVHQNIDAITTWRNLNVSQCQDVAALHQKYGCNSDESQDISHCVSDLLPQPENRLTASFYNQHPSNDASPAHFSSYGYIPEYSANRVNADAMHAAARAIEESSFTDMIATNTAAAGSVIETRDLNNVEFLRNQHIQDDEIRHSSEGCNAEKRTADIDADEATLDVHVGLSRDMYEVAQSVPFASQDLVQSFLPEALSQDFAENSSQGEPQQDQIFQSQLQHSSSQRNYSHDLFQQMPQVLATDAAPVETHVIDTHWRSDEPTFAANPVLSGFHALQNGMHQQIPTTTTATSAIAYLYRDRQSQLCSYG